MGIARFVELGVLIVFLQAFTSESSEEPAACVPGFEAELLIFKVERNRTELQPNRVLGKVGFDDCTGRKTFPFRSENTHFKVESDGTLKVERTVTLHGGQKDFFIHVEAQGRNWTIPVRVLNQLSLLRHGHHHHEAGQGHHHHEAGQGHHHHEAGHGHHEAGHGHHHHNDDNDHGNNNGAMQKDHHHDGNHLHLHHHPSTEVDAANKTEMESTPEVPVLHFPKTYPGLKRRKRAWVIPPIFYTENDRGPFPKQMVQIRSDSDKEVSVVYSITGPGADAPPVGLFTVDGASGQLYVTQPLDRERQASYMLQAYAVVYNSGNAEEPMDIRVIVIDQNDNKPIFVQDAFTGEVAEASPTGFEVLTVNATDLDDPTTDNADVRYSILSQSPELPSKDMFVINPVSGVIRVNAQGLDREKYPQYTLEVQAADMRGDGLTGNAKVILTVTDSNDNAPQFEQLNMESTPEVPVLHFPKTYPGLKRRKRAWVIPPIFYTENDRGPFPIQMVQIRSDSDKEVSVVYSITGPGADAPPVGLFTVDGASGQLYVTQPLDRERQASYMLQAYAVVYNSGNAEEPMDIRVIVIDQNDNKPIFVQDAFTGEVAEASPTGFEVLTVNATDLDDPTTDNADVRYSILSQSPELPSKDMFVINPVSGVIRVNAQGLDREKYPQYTLEVQAADMRGDGLTGNAKVILTVTDSNDNAPQFEQLNMESTPEVPVLHLPKTYPGLKWRKRAWVIPPIFYPENDRGPFPKQMVQIRSDSDEEVSVVYSITGPGADAPPVGLFTVDGASGQLYVTQPLDRERQASYMLQAHAVVYNSGNAEEPMDIRVNVIDQNDNKPIFVQDTFTGEVAEASPTGFEVLTVNATDLDDPTTDNADVRYSILSQSPELPSKDMFVINPVSGVIRVNAQGLDREKYPQYTLEVQAADMRGDGLTGNAKVILTVTDSNDNAPQFEQLNWVETAEDGELRHTHTEKEYEQLRINRTWERGCQQAR